MTNVSSRIVPALAALLLSFGAHAEAIGLPPTVLARAEAAGIAPSAVGVVVRRVGDPTAWIRWQDDQAFQPASTLKLLTAIVALDTLGPDHRGRTEMRTTVAPRGATLRGDVVLRGLGDTDFDAAALERMLGRLRAMGVRRIEGDLLLDRTFFEPARTDVGVAPFDEAPEFRYNVIPDALGLGMNLVHLELAADARRLAIEPVPALPGVRFRSEMQLVAGACEDWEDLWQVPRVEHGAGGRIDVTLLGAFPRGCTAAADINVLERNDFAERLFRMLWTRLGGTFRGRVREAAAPAGTTLVAEHRSRALGERVRDIVKRSDNPVTRITWLTLGTLDASPGTTAQRADAAVRRWLAARGIPDAGLVLENGSGLSRTERIRPETLSAVVEAAMASPWWPELASGLPIAAVDGGLRNRLRETPAARVARLKTGTLRNVSALAGYVDLPGRGRYVIAAMVNDERAHRQDARAVLDALVDFVAREAPAPP